MIKTYKKKCEECGKDFIGVVGESVCEECIENYTNFE